MSARASGSDAKDSDGAAKQRAHHDGSSNRTYTTEQRTTVIRVRRCAPTAFYDILGLESVRTTCSESDIKKAYRKLSLLTHPDKNGFDGADEAFKMVSKAFQVLSDADKRAKFDRFGGDPESRHQQAASASPFGGFARPPGAGGGGGFGGAGASMFDDAADISPEELFRQFFGGGLGGGFPGFGFDTGPQFVFNMGGPGGIRVTQFGGAGPRRRPRPAGADGQPEPPQSGGLNNIFASLLPLILLFILPLISSFLSGSAPRTPQYAFTKTPPFTRKYTSASLKVPYFVNPAEYDELSRRQQHELDKHVEVQTVQNLRYQCQSERAGRDELIMEAQGWFSTDEKKMDKARKMELKACKQLQEYGLAL